MRGFYKIPSLVQVWAAQIVVLFFFSDPLLRLVQLAFKPDGAYAQNRFSWLDLIPWAFGALCLAWLVKTILRPTLGKVRWVPSFGGGGAVVWNGAAAVNYDFPSTHPSYVFMDAIALGLAWFIAYAWSYNEATRPLEAYVIFGLGAFTPALRLVAWYVLGLRPAPPAPGAEAARYTARVLREGWRPVFAFYAVVVPILAVALGLGWIYSARDLERRRAGAIAIDPAALTDRAYFERIRDASVRSTEQSRLARIALVPAATAVRCEHATVKSAVHFNQRLALGAAGDLLLVLKPEHMPQIERRLAAAPGRPVPFMGILVRPPSAVPAWRQHVWCTVPAAGWPRWIFEVEEVLPQR